jgi:thiamine-phosphate pyrophosphorylase
VPNPALPSEPPPSPGNPSQAGDAQDWPRQDWEDQQGESQAGQTVPETVARLLDANLDRAREGLRVLEDWARFGLDRPDLVARTKDLRHRLARVHRDRYKHARHTATDPAAGLSHPAQAERLSPARVLAANAARAQEALRVLEEFGRAHDPALAQEAARSRYALYDLELELMRSGRDGHGRRQLLARCRLYLICGAGAAAAVEGALEAGVGIVQYRAKEGEGLDDRRRLAEARELRRLCQRHAALFVVNDRVDLALAVDADGVHLGQGDLPVAVARRLLGPDRLIGCSTHAPDQLARALAEGCDYVGVGPVNATPTKPGRAPVGLAYVAEAAATCPLPFFAIGGIDAETLPVVLAAGASRVAVVRAIAAARDPGAATRTLLALLDQHPWPTSR